MSSRKQSEVLEQLATEAQQATVDAKAEMERIRQYRTSPEAYLRFNAARRARLWRMPRWFWIPFVVLLVGTALLAMFSFVVA
jgi:hypothetical protein